MLPSRRAYRLFSVRIRHELFHYKYSDLWTNISVSGDYLGVSAPHEIAEGERGIATRQECGQSSCYSRIFRPSI